jgi:hypothetical protein
MGIQAEMLMSEGVEVDVGRNRVRNMERYIVDLG